MKMLRANRGVWVALVLPVWVKGIAVGQRRVCLRTKELYMAPIINPIGDLEYRSCRPERGNLCSLRFGVNKDLGFRFPFCGSPVFPTP